MGHGLFGGYARSVSDSLADTYGGVADSRVVADSRAGYRASADANGIGISVSGPRQYSPVDVRATSRAARFGRGQSRAVAVEIRR